MKWKKINEEVLFPNPNQHVVAVSKSTIDYIKEIASGNSRQRSRLCCHKTTEDGVQEMVIFHPKGTYVPAHKHHNREESIHVIEGELDLITFTDIGSITSILRMGEYLSGYEFYSRTPASVFHAQVFLRDTIFHEVSKGPFVTQDNVIAPWAPVTSSVSNVEEYASLIKVSQE